MASREWDSERIPDSSLRREFVQVLAEQANRDDPPFAQDFWRLNLHAIVPNR